MIIDDKYLNSDGSMPEWLSELARVSKHIENALEYNGGTHNIDDIVSSVATGEMQLWSNKDTAIIGMVSVHPQKKTYHILLAGGNLEEIEEMAPSIIHFAKFMGCEGITMSGRKGWERTPLFKKLGFTPMQIVMKMEI